MPELPTGLEHFRSTPEYDAKTVPAGLRMRHSLKAGVWGRIVVGEGRLLYVVECEPETSFVLQPGVPGIIAPEQMHRVEQREAVRFHVEFWRVKGST
jgi:tellurite resistance-related uncharacterized protein